MKAVASGRPEALGELYGRHGPALFRHALALAHRHADAEDLVQAVFVKLATTGAELLGVRAPASYLHRMLHTTWLDARRRVAAGERAVAHGENGQGRPPALEDTMATAQALDGLPPLQREAVVLHLVEGCSFREVGRRTGVSMFTAAARYRLALAKLRKALAGPREARR